MTKTKTREAGFRRLQRGRAHASAEIPHKAPEKHAPTHASTGPRSRERGDPDASGCREGDAQASTGPRSRERGDNIRSNCIYQRFFGFNGAALTRARRSRPSTWTGMMRACFNGAALTRARRLDNIWLLCTVCHASTGPRSRERGDSLSNPRWRVGVVLQRGRAHASAEIALPAP